MTIARRFCVDLQDVGNYRYSRERKLGRDGRA